MENREAKYHNQGHTAGKRRNRVSNLLLNRELNERQQNERFSSRIKLCLTNRKKALNIIENQTVLERTKLRKSPGYRERIRQNL